MRLASRRTAATSLALALLAACGSKNSPPAPPGPLELACSVSDSASGPVLTVVGRATTAATTGAPITVTMQVQPALQAFTLSPPGWVGSGEFRGVAVLEGQALVGLATVDGKEAVASCTAAAGLPVTTAHLTRITGGASLGWTAVPGAAVYRWTLRDGPGGAVITSGTTSGTTATATATLDLVHPYVAEVGAYALTGAETTYPMPLPTPKASFGRALFTAGSTGGDGVTAWQLFGPGDYVSGALTATYPTLASGERLAVLLVNAGGDDLGYATVSATGTGNPNQSLATTAPLLAMAAGRAGGAGPGDGGDRADVLAGEVLVSAWREETIARLRDGRLRRAPSAGPAVTPLAATAAAAALPATRYFCQGQITSSGSWTMLWRSATKAYETTHAAFYYTDEVKPGIDAAVAARGNVIPSGGPAPFFGEMGAAYEANILPALNKYFGLESDVDANGKVIFLFANLGKTSASTFPVGYFWPGDVELPLASATTCPRSIAGNRADMLYLTDPGTFTGLWVGRGDYNTVLGLIVDGEYPSTMAHELQHDVNYNTRFPQGSAGGVDEELWLNEGLSMLSETVSGYGLHTKTGRANVRSYQGTDSSGLPYYQGYGMTVWEGDPYGNYAGVQAYMQYLLDHATPAMTKALENPSLTGKANIEAATGVPWEVGFARFTTAAMFSNEDASKYAGGLVTSAGNLLADVGLNYVGDLVSPDYVPWHKYTGSCTVGGVSYDKPRTAYVAWTPITSSASATLRKDGWAAFATGPGAGTGGATVTVQSSAAVRPYVVVVKYKNFLPNYSLDLTCP